MFRVRLRFSAIFMVIMVLVCSQVGVPVYAMDQHSEAMRAKTTAPISMAMVDDVDVIRDAVVSAGDCVGAVGNVLFVGTSTMLAVELLLSDSSCLHIIQYNPHVVETWALSGAVTLVAMLSSALCPVRPSQEMCVESPTIIYKQD